MLYTSQSVMVVQNDGFNFEVHFHQKTRKLKWNHNTYNKLSLVFSISFFLFHEIFTTLNLQIKLQEYNEK